MTTVTPTQASKLWLRGWDRVLQGMQKAPDWLKACELRSQHAADAVAQQVMELQILIGDISTHLDVAGSVWRKLVVERQIPKQLAAAAANTCQVSLTCECNSTKFIGQYLAVKAVLTLVQSALRPLAPLQPGGTSSSNISKVIHRIGPQLEQSGFLQHLPGLLDNAAQLLDVAAPDLYSDNQHQEGVMEIDPSASSSAVPQTSVLILHAHSLLALHDGLQSVWPAGGYEAAVAQSPATVLAAMRLQMSLIRQVSRCLRLMPQIVGPTGTTADMAVGGQLKAQQLLNVLQTAMFASLSHWSQAFKQLISAAAHSLTDTDSLPIVATVQSPAAADNVLMLAILSLYVPLLQPAQAEAATGSSRNKQPPSSTAVLALDAAQAAQAWQQACAALPHVPPSFSQLAQSMGLDDRTALWMCAGPPRSFTVQTMDAMVQLYFSLLELRKGQLQMGSSAPAAVSGIQSAQQQQQQQHADTFQEQGQVQLQPLLSNGRPAGLHLLLAAALLDWTLLVLQSPAAQVDDQASCVHAALRSTVKALQTHRWEVGLKEQSSSTDSQQQPTAGDVPHAEAASASALECMLPKLTLVTNQLVQLQQGLLQVDVSAPHSSTATGVGATNSCSRSCEQAASDARRAIGHSLATFGGILEVITAIAVDPKQQQTAHTGRSAATDPQRSSVQDCKQLLATWEACLRATTGIADQVFVGYQSAEYLQQALTECTGASRAGMLSDPVLFHAAAGGPEQLQLFALLCSMLKCSRHCMELQPGLALRHCAAVSAVISWALGLDGPKGPTSHMQLSAASSAAAAAATSAVAAADAAAAHAGEEPLPWSRNATVAACWWMLLLGRCCLIVPEALQNLGGHAAPAAALLAGNVPVVFTDKFPDLDSQSNSGQGVKILHHLDFPNWASAMWTTQVLLQDSAVAAHLSAAGYDTQPLLQALQAAEQSLQRVAAMLQSGPVAGSADFDNSAAELMQQLECVGLALNTLATPHVCNNPRCMNASGPTELQLVNGRSCVCGGCLVAHYCSKACQRKHWKQHKPMCQALAASQAGSTSVSS